MMLTGRFIQGFIAVPLLLGPQATPAVFAGETVAGAPVRYDVKPDSTTSILARYLTFRRNATTVPVDVSLCSTVAALEQVESLRRQLDGSVAVSVHSVANCARQPAAVGGGGTIPLVLVRAIRFRGDTAEVAASVWHGSGLRIDETATLLGPRWGVLGLTFHVATHSDRVGPRVGSGPGDGRPERR